MSLVAVASAHGAPGATTLLMGLAAAWPVDPDRHRLVIEADPDGGVLASRFDELRADRTLADVAVDVRRGFDLGKVLASARPVWDSVAVVVAPPSADHTAAALTAAADRLAVGFAAAPAVDVLTDVGRLTVRSPALPLAHKAAWTILVARPSFEDVACLVPRKSELAAAGCRLGLVVVGDRPYHPTEVAEALGLPLLAVVPSDPMSAGLLSGGRGNDRRLRRSLLWRVVADLASRLAAETAASGESLSGSVSAQRSQDSRIEA